MCTGTVNWIGLYKLIKKEGSVVGRDVEGRDSVGAVEDHCIVRKLHSFVGNSSHFLHNTYCWSEKQSHFRLILLHYKTERLRRSFVFNAIRIYSALIEATDLTSTSPHALYSFGPFYIFILQ